MAAQSDILSGGSAVRPHSRRETARDRAVRSIRDDIISLALPPGLVMSEKELADGLGMSRTPVREALIELGKSAIVEIVPQYGSRVAKIDYDLVEEASFMRLTLETAVVEAACREVSPEVLREQEGTLALQDTCRRLGDAGGLLKLDNDFHRRFFAAYRKNLSYVLMKTLAVHFDRVRSMSLTAVRNIKIVEDHMEILSAVRDRDPELAKAVMRRHLTRYQLDREAIRSQYPGEYFKD